MKLTLTLISFIWVAVLSAQTYNPFLEEDKYWTVETNDYINIPPVVYQNTYYYQGDTTIDLQSYKNYGVILREDTIQKKVYLRDEGYLGGECLLYDFSAQTGDTIETCNFTITIDSVSTILLLNNENRKIFYYSGTITGEYYIEGIGSNEGFRYLSELVGPPSFDLMCVKQNDIEIYGSRCDEIVGVREDLSVKSNVIIYPNPCANLLIIDSESEIKTIKIIDISGKIIKSINGDLKTVDVNGMENGIYLLNIIMTGGRMITKKFIKK